MIQSEQCIIALAEKIIKQQSFQYKTFDEARTVLEMDGRMCEFDRLSLRIYSHNLLSNEYNVLCKQMRLKHDSKFSREDQKAISEYGILLDYLQLKSMYSSMEISKQIRPDFHLRDASSHIGIEVTELTTEEDSVLKSIAKQNFGIGLTAKEIQENAIKKHGEKAKKYYYYDLGDTTAIGSGIFDCFNKKEKYAAEIIKKCNLYRDMFNYFNLFIILCDAREPVSVTHEIDSDEIIQIVKGKAPDVSGFNVAILRQNEMCQLVVDEYCL